MGTEALDFRLLFESAPGLFLVLKPDAKFSIVAVSQAYLDATLTKREQIMNRGLFEVFPDDPNDPKADGVRNLRASLNRVVANKRADSMAVQKYSIERADGTFEERHWSPRNFPVLDTAGALTFIIHRVEDVTDYVSRAGRMEAEIIARAQELQLANTRLREMTERLEIRVSAETAERERIETQFRQAQKMEAVGQLAGGVAHDFNNLLTVILSCTDMAKNALGPQHDAAADLADIEGAAQRAAALTRQLLSFSRTHVVNPTTVDLNRVVTEATSMLKRLVGEHISLESVGAPELDAVRIDRSLIDQVLLNLVVNARDAMPDGGKITIETANMELDGTGRGYFSAPAGRYVMLAVTDTGTGMSEDTQERIFLPFFTTKGIGRGTGLGLAMVHGVVKEARGEILLYSALGKGSTFKILLPADGEAVRPTAIAATATPVERPTETVFLVEDEEPVREIARRVLMRAGYKLVVANNPLDAMALASDPSVQFDVVLTDVVMPGMDGPSFVQRLLSVPGRESLRVVFMSGYTGGALKHQKVLESKAKFLQKPFVPAQLLQRIREALD
ncbi:MAG: ATP-binding protein [Archangium sp.]